ncbi:MAG: DUF5989 family protein [Planctomycetota bacterium]|nr:hypothetical protein [Planctomycetota bacterium]MDP6518790.1 DUF5989 family protein [Planctomycetota bacterium]MDP6839667.1 DUF5989 family protein [Planctomycetota bacterium]
MKALNIILALLMSALLAGLVLEGGLRLVGFAPAPSLHEFDGELGWTKRPGAVGSKKTSEFRASFEINALGLRDDAMETPAKPDGVFRVLCLGDSFVLGTTVERRDLFSDLLENYWHAQGRRIEVINAGTEGWSTDQEVRWFQLHGAAFEPDLVLLFPYENDIYWNGQENYNRYPKPRFTASGTLERRGLTDPGERPGWERTGLATFVNSFAAAEAPPTFETPDGTAVFAEWGAWLSPAPDFIASATERTAGALKALKNACARSGARLMLAPIPNKAALDEAARASAVAQLPPAAGDWDPARPVETFLALAHALDIPTMDARPALAAALAQGQSLYYERDWHFNPAGNRVFAAFLDETLTSRGLFPSDHAAQQEAVLGAKSTAPAKPRRWPFVLVTLWLVIATAYSRTYKDESTARAFLQVGGLLSVVFTIALGGGALLALIPPAYSALVGSGLALVIACFLLYHLGRRLATVGELLVAFTRRGHWYLLPLVVVLLSIGSLLVVAASSPLVAPFIYTLF